MNLSLYVKTGRRRPHYLLCFLLLQSIFSFAQISGPEYVCPNTNYSYYCDAPGVSFRWSITGGTIVSGKTSRTCAVKWNSGSARTLNVTTTAPKTGDQESFQLAVYDKTIVPGSVSGPSSLCWNSEVSLNLSGNNSNVLRWERSTDGVTWTPINITTTSCTFAPLSQNMQFRAVIDGAGCGVFYTNSLAVNTIAPPVIASTTAPSRCGPGTVTAGAYSAGAVKYRWYDGAGMLVGTTTTGSYSFYIAGATTFYVSAIGSNGCESAWVAITANMLTVPDAPAVPTIDNYCDYTKLTRVDPGPGFTSHWQYTDNYGVPGDVSREYTASVPGTYYIRTRNETTGCWSPATSVTVAIHQRPNTPLTPVIQDACDKMILTRAEPQHGITWYWQTAADGTSMGNSGSSYTATVNGAVYLRARDNVNSCWSRIGAAVEVNIKPSLSCLDGQGKNFVVKDQVFVEGVKQESEIKNLAVGANLQTVSYMDGLGRPIQQVQVQAGAAKNDVVQIIGYDALGRESRKYLPYPVSGQGRYQANAVAALTSYYGAAGDHAVSAVPWSETIFEASPLNKVLEQGFPGESWQPGTGKTVRQRSYANAGNEVRRWVYDEASGQATAASFYEAGDLLVEEVQNEENFITFRYIDKQNRLVSEKRQIKGSDYTQSYYVYNEIGQIAMVIQPQGVQELNAIGGTWSTNATFFNNWCFTYRYDAGGRLTEKKMPGAAPVYYVYNKRDQIILTQDGEQRKSSTWAFSKYDGLKRPVLTGLYRVSAAISQAAMQAQADNYAGHFEIRSASNFDRNFGYTVDRSFPALAGGSEIFSVNYYDDYDFDNNPATADVAYMNSGMSTEPVPSYETNNHVTGKRVMVLGQQKMLLSVLFYDKWGRTIQTQRENFPAGKSIVTNRFDFAGQLLETQQQRKDYSTPVKLRKTYMYDHAQRLLETQQQINDNPIQTLSDNVYTELGHLKVRDLAPNYNNGRGMEHLHYEYNIRGWLLGVNRGFAKTATDNSAYFGYDLGYDNPAISVSGSSIGSYEQPTYDGNLSGVVWKSKGDQEIRKFDFAYDGAGRLMNAEFNQYTSGSFNRSAGVDFSMRIGNGIDPATGYDANGNLLAITQSGLKAGSSSIIDQLSYQYTGNQLQAVADAMNEKDSKLGDFHYDPATKGAIDYVYDANGNMVSNANKGIHSISYNHLNLPKTIVLKDKGAIDFTYDAGGNKLRKVVVDNTVYPAKITYHVYQDGFQYQNDTLQQFAHEHGRVRVSKADTSLGLPPAFINDYFLKDHLGNIRMVLTEERQSNLYPAASMEAVNRALEDALYGNIAKTASVKPAGYPADTYTSPNDMVAKVNGSGNKIGPAMMLKVMAGDTLNIRANAWYRQEGTASSVPVNPLPDLLTAISAGVAGAGGKLTAAELNGSAALGSGLLQFLNNNNKDENGRPRAYLNWILLDEQFKYVPAGSGAEQVGSNEEFKTFIKAGMPVTKNGYLYVYVSNETAGQDVYFDNLQVSHARGPLLEESHYYPFGLTMAGISSKAIKSPYVENRQGITGKELQSKEFLDGSGLDAYDFGARMYDAQIGRWNRMDNAAESYYNLSPYNYTLNNPVNVIDPDGNDVYVIVWFTKENQLGHAAIAVDNYKTTKKVVRERWVDEKNLNRVRDVKKDVGVPDGSMTYYDLWPQKPVSREKALSPVTPDYNKRTIKDVNELKTKDVSVSGEAGSVSVNGEGRPADGIIKVPTTYEETMKISERLEATQKSQTNYNGAMFNCSSYVRAGLRTVFDHLDGTQVIHPSLLISTFTNYSPLKVVTPNDLYNAASGLKGATNIHGPRTVTSKPYLQYFDE